MSQHVDSKKRKKFKNTGITYSLYDIESTDKTVAQPWRFAANIFSGDKNKKRKKNKFTYSKPVKHHYKRTVQLDIRIKPHATKLGVQRRDKMH